MKTYDLKMPNMQVYYWGDFPDRDTRSVYWNRAKHDAHATVRGNK